MPYITALLLYTILIKYLITINYAGSCNVNNRRSDITYSLTMGAARGTTTIPLHKAHLIDNSGAITGSRIVYFVVMDSSDSNFQNQFGGAKTSKLKKVPDSALESDTEFHVNPSDGIYFTFHEYPGKIAHLDNGQYIRTTNNPNYSPVKKVTYNGNTVYANLPLIKWGDEDGENLIVDQDGCQALIRGIPPSPFNYPPNDKPGPPGCFVGETPLNRYKGGQLLSIDTTNMKTEIKLHFSIHSENKFPHYVVFETNKLPASEFMGVIHAPKLNNLVNDPDSTALIYQFANGVHIESGGPNRFQPGIAEYADANGGSYTPLWEINWFFWDCDEDGQFWDSYNRGNCGNCPDESACVENAVCPASSIPTYNPSNPATFDPFQMDDKGVWCRNTAKLYADDTVNGIIYSIDEADDLESDGKAIITRGPPGLSKSSNLQGDLFVNCPTILTLDGSDCLVNSNWLSGDPDP